MNEDRENEAAAETDTGAGAAKDYGEFYHRVRGIEWFMAVVLAAIFLAGTISGFIHYKPAEGQLNVSNYSQFVKFSGRCNSYAGSVIRVDAHIIVRAEITKPSYEIPDIAAVLAVSADGGRGSQTCNVIVKGMVNEKRDAEAECTIPVEINSFGSGEIAVTVKLIQISGVYRHV